MQQPSTRIHTLHRSGTLTQEKTLAEQNGSYHWEREQDTGVAWVRVLLVDNHALVREGLRHLFTLQQGIQLVGEATESTSAIHLVERLRPDVVLLEMHQSHQETLDALALMRRITQSFPNIAVLLLSGQRSQQYVTQAFKSGARGYLLTNASTDEVTRAVRIVHEGGTYIGQELANTLAHGLRPASEDRTLNGRRQEPQLLDVLSDKEIELVRLVARGMSNKEIADVLAYSEKTVKNYLSVIFQKLNIRDRTQAAILAYRQGILDVE